MFRNPFAIYSKGHPVCASRNDELRMSCGLLNSMRMNWDEGDPLQGRVGGSTASDGGVSQPAGPIRTPIDRIFPLVRLWRANMRVNHYGNAIEWDWR